MCKTYQELCKFKTFGERFNYLKMSGIVGRTTFGFDRYLNQVLYRSSEWKRIRNEVLIRDDGCDLGVFDYKVYTRPIVHHINPITMHDIDRKANCIFDLNNLICTSHITHNAIHYGDESLLIKLPQERKKGDTILWK